MKDLILDNKMEGFQEVNKILKNLQNDKLINGLLKKTNRQLLGPVRKSFKGLNYPKSLLSKVSIRAAKVNGSRHPNALSVGPTNDVFPLRFLNTGTIERYTKEGAYRGRIIGKKLIEPYLLSEAKEVDKKAKTEYGQVLDSVIAKDVKRITKKK